MMDWTDRHCRYLHRLYAPHALLYTEMIAAQAIVRGDRAHLLRKDPAEDPVALQLGGCDPEALALAARAGEAAGYAEINLNVGCPSDRVRDGSFGACLMGNPPLVADCVRRMRDAVSVPVTVKCRIGIDDRSDYEFFEAFAAAQAAAGADALIVHARAAILGGLTPKQNREIPPLHYAHVHRLKRERPHWPIVVNGGLNDVAAAVDQLRCGLDGIMVGRAAYHRPAMLAELERVLVDPTWTAPPLPVIVERMVQYAGRCAAEGVRLHSITRHMHGLVAGTAGARGWRRFLAEVAAKPDAEPEVLYAALPLLKMRIAA